MNHERVNDLQHSFSENAGQETKALELSKSESSTENQMALDIANTICEKMSVILKGTDYIVSDVKSAVIPVTGKISSAIENTVKGITNKFIDFFDCAKEYVKKVDGECLAQDIADKGQLYDGIKKLAIGGGIVTAIFIASSVVPVPVVGMVLVCSAKGAALSSVSGALIDGGISFAKAVKNGEDINGAIKSFVNKSGSGAISGAVTGGIFGAATGLLKVPAFKANETALIAEKTGVSTKTVNEIMNPVKADAKQLVAEANAVNVLKNADKTIEKGAELDVGDRLLLVESIEDKIAHTPREGINGTWSGERGNSLFKPFGDILPKGVEGIQYKDGYPDFSKVAQASVKIDNMTGTRSTNFMQCNTKLADMWNSIGHNGKTDWTPRAISEFQRVNGLTWHECQDMTTCQLVPSKIHSIATHCGGVSLCKALEPIGGIV